MKTMTAKLDGTFGRVDATVRSSQPIEPENILLSVQGIGLSDLPVAIHSAAENLYKVEIKRIPLVVGKKNELELVISNRLGHTREADLATLEPVAPERKTIPELEVRLADGTSVTSSKITFDVTVTSDQELQLVVRRGRDQVFRSTMRPANGRQQEFAVDVDLLDGPNQIVVTATDVDGHVVTVRRDVSRIDAPSSIAIQSVIDSAQIRAPNELSKPDVFVSGVVNAADTFLADGKVDDSELVVRGWVNGFMQSVGRLTPNGSGTYTFRLKLLLNEANSLIRVDLPGLPESENSFATAAVKCSSPSSDQVLHLLVASTGVDDYTSLSERIHQSFRIRNGTAPGFSTVIGSEVYPPITGKRRSDSLHMMFARCQFVSEGFNAQPNVVMFYFEGTEIRDQEGQFGLLTYDVEEGLFAEPTLMTSRKLADYFAEMRGAHLVFLDVANHPQSHPVGQAGDPGCQELGVVRRERGNNGWTLLDDIKKFFPQVLRLSEFVTQIRNDKRFKQSIATVEKIRVNRL